MQEFKTKLKKIIIKELSIEDLTPDEIKDDAPLFGTGLGLDSLDAVELVIVIQKHFGIKIKNMEDGKIVFQSINALAEFILKKQKDAKNG